MLVVGPPPLPPPVGHGDVVLGDLSDRCASYQVLSTGIVEPVLSILADAQPVEPPPFATTELCYRVGKIIGVVPPVALPFVVVH